jgi:quercetin dioxygenase-like cupin family protein
MDVQPKKPTVKGPADRFTGDVWIDSIVEPADGSTLNVGHVHFTPGARTAWHSHPGGQTLYVTEGRGRVQSRGEPIVELRPGDTHVTPHAHEHWHGASRDHLMSHITITHSPTIWGDHVTDSEYELGG